MTRDRQQDAEMDRLLRAALSAAPAGPADACPPPDDLAAYVERTLDTGERETLEVHLAACQRCQESLAMMASLPETPAPTAASRGRAPWLAGWRRWLVPATALASALILYVALKPDASLQRSVSPGDPVAATTTAPPSEQERISADAGATRPSPPAQGGGEIARSEPVEALPFRKGPGEPPAPDSLRGKAVNTLETGTTVTAESRLQQDRAVAPVPELAAAPMAAPSPPPAAPAPAGAAAMAEAQASKPLTGSGGGVLAMRPARMRADESAKGSQEAMAEAAAPTLIRAAGPTPRLWRLDPGARILASADGGATWELQHDGAGELTAGSAPSPEVCWAVGAAGLVLRTTDGKTWEARPFPENLDLVAADATDALHASVVARTGRRFATSDGGRTWSVVR